MAFSLLNSLPTATHARAAQLPAQPRSLVGSVQPRISPAVSHGELHSSPQPLYLCYASTWHLGCMLAAAAHATAASACAFTFITYHVFPVSETFAAKRQRRCECAAAATAAGPKVMLANGLVDYYEVLGVSWGTAVDRAFRCELSGLSQALVVPRVDTYVLQAAGRAAWRLHSFLQAVVGSIADDGSNVARYTLCRLCQAVIPASPCCACCPGDGCVWHPC
jgi:hypothetical protein